MKAEITINKVKNGFTICVNTSSEKMEYVARSESEVSKVMANLVAIPKNTKQATFIIEANICE